MKESEIKNIPIRKILEKTGDMFSIIDIKTVMRFTEAEKEELDSEINILVDSQEKDRKDIFDKKVRDFLERHEENIDKAALVTILLYNYTRKLIEYNAKGPESMFAIKAIKDKINATEEMLKGMNKNVYRLHGGENNTIYIGKISSSYLLGEKSTKRYNTDEQLKKLEENHIRMQNLLNSIILTDFWAVICEPDLGELIRYQTFYNALVEQGIDPEKLQTGETIEGLAKDIEFPKLIPHLEQAVRENLEDIDLDKLALCSAYRYIEYLEDFSAKEKEENVEEIIQRLVSIWNYIKDKNVKIEGNIENPNPDNGEIELGRISYKVKDLMRDLEKIEGNTYWGQAKIKQTKEKLQNGEISLADVNIGRLNLSREEITDLAKQSNQNYDELLKNGLVKPEDIKEINSQKTSLSSESIKMLIEQKLLAAQELLDLYMQGKIEIADAINPNMDVKKEISAEMLYKEYKEKDNDERKIRMKSLYEKLFLEGKTKEELDENKDNAIDEYVQTMNAEYLEMFVALGTLKIEDLDGILLGEEWVKALEKEEISEEFFVKLQEHNIIENEVITGNDEVVARQMKLWEEGKISSEQIKKLNIDFYDILKMCDEGIIKGTRIGDLISKEDFRKYRDQISSNYAYGMYDTLRPLFLAYNSKILNADRTIKIIEEMKVSSEEVASFCKEGLLTGERIAELRYKGILKKKQYRELKEEGFISDEEEIAVLNNLTPQEMLKELDANGCERIEQLEKILGDMNFTKTKRGKNGDTKSHDKKIINPIIRYKMLELLGTDIIVENPDKGFNGYQAFLIPSLGVAVLEKLFREDRYGEIRPSYGDATYICEIGKYIQVSGQSKREIRDFMNVEGNSNGNVSIINHSSQWGNKLIKEIQNVNPNIEIDKEKGNITAIKNKGEDKGINTKELNTVIEQISKKEATISLEEYE